MTQTDETDIGRSGVAGVVAGQPGEEKKARHGTRRWWVQQQGLTVADTRRHDGHEKE